MSFRVNPVKDIVSQTIASTNLIIDNVPGFADLAKETTLQDVDNILGNIDTKTPALGQALSAASVPVVLASDSTIVDNLAKETTLSSINLKTPSLGQALLVLSVYPIDSTPNVLGSITWREL